MDVHMPQIKFSLKLEKTELSKVQEESSDNEVGAIGAHLEESTHSTIPSIQLRVPI